MRTRMIERPVTAVLILAAGLAVVAAVALAAYPRMSEQAVSSLPPVVTGLAVEDSGTAQPGSTGTASPAASSGSPRSWPIATRTTAGSGGRLVTYGDMNDISRALTREVVLPPVREEQDRDGGSSGGDR